MTPKMAFLFCMLVHLLLVSMSHGQFVYLERNETSTSAEIISPSASESQPSSMTYSVEPVLPTTTSFDRSSTVIIEPTIMPSGSSTHLLPSSSVHPVTTPKPTKAPSKVVDYKVMDGKNICIDLKAEITFDVTYKSTLTNKMETATFDLQSGGNVTGECANASITTAMIKVSFDLYDFSMDFTVDKNNAWTTTNITLNVITSGNKAFHNASADTISATSDKASNLDLLKGSAGKSYSCQTNQDLKLGKDVTIKIGSIQLQPFELKNGNFSAADTCPKKKDKSKKDNNIVPIAVGCALAGLIVIVLIAYLIGRRKTHRGYQQV